MSTHTWYVVVGADAVGQEAIPDLPGEDGGALSLVLGNSGHYPRGGNPGLGTANGSGLNGAGLVVPVGSMVGCL